MYRSRTVFEDASPEIVRDFFWDDEFRPKWDPMLAYFKTLEEDTHTGTTIVHWIKKVVFLLMFWSLFVDVVSHFFPLQFPFFCSDREYIIGRRIWESGKKYYAVTKVTSCVCFSHGFKNVSLMVFSVCVGSSVCSTTKA